MCWAELISIEEQIRAATMHDARTFLSTTAEGEGFCATAEEVYATRTKEEEMVRELLNGWQKGAHKYIPEVKDNNVIRLGCENVNSLSIFHPTKSKMCKLTHLHQRHQTGGACIVEHGINLKMAATGTRPEDLFLGMCSGRVSAGHNINIYIDKIRAISLLEANYNWLNKFVFSKQMMDKAFEGDIISAEQFAKRGSQATEGVLTSGLFCDIALALQRTASIESVDLANCMMLLLT